MMSEMGKEITEAVPALDLSTQDFILRSTNGEQRVASSAALCFSVNLQQ